MCIQSVRVRPSVPPSRVTPSHRISNEGIEKEANEARVKTESLPVLPPLLFQPAGCGFVFNFGDTMVEGAQYGAGFFAGDKGRIGGCLNVYGDHFLSLFLQTRLIPLPFLSPRASPLPPSRGPCAIRGLKGQIIARRQS